MKYNSLNEIAEKVVSEILKNKEPFTTPVVVCHNTKMAQWFKNYYLKNNDRVLMNVKFVPLAVFINEIVNPEKKYQIMDRAVLRDYIIKVLLSTDSASTSPSNCYAHSDDPEDPANYVFQPDGKISGINLFELADRLATLFLYYEFDEEFGGGLDGDLDGKAWIPGKEEGSEAAKERRKLADWEQKVYEKAMKLAEKDGWFTTKRLFEKQKKDNGLKQYTDKDPVYVIDNSYITNLCKDILNAAGITGERIYSLEPEGFSEMLSEEEGKSDKVSIEFPKDGACRLVSAPSRIREVEALHSDICKKILTGPYMKFSDIIVYAPSISDYAACIRRVFDQDDKEFPSIPYRIAGESKEKKDMSDALSLLFDIANKGFFTRNDFYKYVKIPMIQRKWGITDDDVKAWMDAIIQTNTHRNQTAEEQDDWEYFRKRVLLQRLVSNTSDLENKTELDGESYLPFYSMNLKEDSMEKMLDVLDALNDWNKLFVGCSDLNDMRLGEEKLKKVSDCLDKLLSIKNKDNEERNYLYREVRSEVELLTELGVDIPANTVMMLLMSTVGSYSTSPADLFSGGITFMNLSCDDIAAAKHIYVIGLSSSAFPRTDVRSELDISQKHRSSEILDRLSLRNLCTGAGNLTFSYVNCDLQTDEEFYPSSLIIDYFTTEKKEDRIPNTTLDKNKAMVISLDEKRDYGELFTKKEFRQKNYDEKLCGKQAEPEKIPDFFSGVKSCTEKREDKVIRLSDIKHYLENPFTYKFDRIMKTEEDKDTQIQAEYEVIDIAGLAKYNIIKDMIVSATQEERTEEQNKEKTQLEKSLPEGEIGSTQHELYYKTSAAPLIDILKTGYKYETLDPLKMNAVIGSNSVSWTLDAGMKMYRKAGKNETDWYYIEPIDFYPPNGLDNKKFLNMYTFSLMDLASQEDFRGREYTIHLGPPDKERSFSMTSDSAKELLNQIYENMMNYEQIKYMDLDNINKEETGNPKTLTELKADTIDDEHSELRYFPDKKLVDPYQDFGYSDDFGTEFEKEKNRLKELLVFPIEKKESRKQKKEANENG